jgi:hypothetical protein
MLLSQQFQRAFRYRSLGRCSGAFVASLSATITDCAASSHGIHINRAACSQSVKGSIASCKLPSASKDGIARRLIEICSQSPSGDCRRMMSMSRPGRRALALVASISLSRAYVPSGMIYCLHAKQKFQVASCPSPRTGESRPLSRCIPRSLGAARRRCPKSRHATGVLPPPRQNHCSLGFSSLLQEHRP